MRAMPWEEGSERNYKPIEGRIAIDQVYPLEAYAQQLLVRHQPMQASAREQPLFVAAEFDHHEL
jgi:hypothetical protein